MFPSYLSKYRFSLTKKAEIHEKGTIPEACPVSGKRVLVVELAPSYGKIHKKPWKMWAGWWVSYLCHQNLLQIEWRWMDKFPLLSPLFPLSFFDFQIYFYLICLPQTSVSGWCGRVIRRTCQLPRSGSFPTEFSSWSCIGWLSYSFPFLRFS